MVISTKKVIILALLGLSCLGAYPIYRTLKISQNSQKTAILQPFLEGKLAHTGNKPFNEVLAQELEQEHSQLLDGIQKAFSIPDDQWKEVLESLAEAKQEDTLLKDAHLYKENPNDHEIVRLAKSILVQAGINPSHVNVYIKTTQNKTNASAGQGYTKEGVVHELEINDANFCQKSLQEQECIINHEIRHLYYYDGLERALLMALAKKHDIDAKTFMGHDAVKAYFKFQEFRADLSAAVQNLKVAQEFKKFFKSYIDKNIYPHYRNGKSSASHPTDEERYEMIDRLIQYMEVKQ